MTAIIEKIDSGAIATVSEKSNATRNLSMGRILLDRGRITPQDAERVLRLQRETGLRFGEAAQKLGLISERDIQQVLAQQFDYPYLQQGEGGFSSELVAAYKPFSAQVETFRAVRSQLILRWLSGDRKALVIAAVNPGDGASFVAANLAVVFSQLGESTLLVDANMRKPRQHEIFRLQEREGVSDIIAGRCGIDAVSRVPLLENLSVVGAGTLPPNPQELLSRPTFAALNKQMTSNWDVVLIDVPAFLSAADVLSVCASVGGVLLVARRHQTRSVDVAAAVDQITAVGASVVGTMLVE